MNKILLFMAAITLSMATAFAQYNEYFITLLTNPVEGGTVTGSGVYPDGTVVTVCATPNLCFKFLYWEEDGVIITYDMCYMFTVTQSHNLVAHFSPAILSVEIAGPTIVCDESNITLYAITDPVEIPNATYQWYMNGMLIDVTDVPVYTIYLESASYPYCFKVGVIENGYGCIFMSSTWHCIYVNQLPMIAISSDKTEIYAGEFVQLTADVPANNPGVIYQWYANGVAIPGANAPVHYANPSTTTVYTFTATATGSDCVAESNEITITVVSKSPVEITGPNLVCGAGTVTLQAVLDPELTNVIYTWYMDGMVIYSANSAVLNTDVEPRANPYCFILNVIDTQTGSSFMSPVHHIYAETTAMINITADKDDISTGDTVVLKANVSGLFNRIYKWFANGAPIPGGNTPTIHVTPTATTTYTFTATYLDCISESNEIKITVAKGNSILNLDNDNIKLYPNPSDGQFTITSEKIIENFEMYDLLGKKVFEAAPKTKTTQINTNLQHGLYIYRAVLQDNSISSGKIIIE